MRVYFGQTQFAFDIALAQLLSERAQLAALYRIQRGSSVRQHLALLLSCFLGTKFRNDVHSVLPILAAIGAKAQHHYYN